MFDSLNNPNKIVTIKEQVYDIIKELILSGKAKPGEWLQETKLANELNVSRSPVREALKQLVGEGILENIPNKGVFVRTLSKKDIIDIFELRLTLEKYAIKKTIELITTEKLSVFDDIYTKLEENFINNNASEYCKVDTELHNMFFYLSDNMVAYKVNKNTFSMMQPFRIISLRGEQRFKESLIEHKGIIDGIKERNFEKAWGFNKTHLTLAKNEILKYIKEQENNK
ncbi:GntR family transcriptional regulator [Clostridium aestuarii]|uniref:GntR family transcriptional regulator n=1 Tax=Clostridium aestuarii TaxID=338193 RepID=A0ABT4D046_9CLOT|nr:GntR family transcriptional regulator [Clostridium aestuarii]MCY6484609.1 GntR family transcriptional regulator [Clostridium aestuarii]